MRPTTLPTQMHPGCQGSFKRLEKGSDFIYIYIICIFKLYTYYSGYGLSMWDTLIICIHILFLGFFLSNIHWDKYPRNSNLNQNGFGYSNIGLHPLLLGQFIAVGQSVSGSSFLGCIYIYCMLCIMFVAFCFLFFRLVFWIRLHKTSVWCPG